MNNWHEVGNPWRTPIIIVTTPEPNTPVLPHSWHHIPDVSTHGTLPHKGQGCGVVRLGKSNKRNKKFESFLLGHITYNTICSKQPHFSCVPACYLKDLKHCFNLEHSIMSYSYYLAQLLITFNLL